VVADEDFLAAMDVDVISSPKLLMSGGQYVFWATARCERIYLFGSKD
jgi:hypothetical protein